VRYLLEVVLSSGEGDQKEMAVSLPHYIISGRSHGGGISSVKASQIHVIRSLVASLTKIMLGLLIRAQCFPLFDV
jgi:hypothetical protein